MAEQEACQAFLSYARRDAKTHSTVFLGLEARLPDPITSKPMNAPVGLWCDADGIRTRDTWDQP